MVTARQHASWSSVLMLALGPSLAACDSDGSDDPAGTSDAAIEAGDPGVHVGEREVVFRTEPVTLEPDEERYLCYATTIEQALAIDGYHHEGAPYLHHVVFSRTRAPEPEGTSECDTLFRPTWDPLYLAGAGSSSLKFPNGVGHMLDEGSQLVAQLHLLNTREEPITASVDITMERAADADLRPMGAYAFGTSDVHLPPRQATTLEAVCVLDEPVELVAAFPHMHLLGKAMSFEVGPSEDAMELVFERDPYDFDDQRVELLGLSLEPGDVTRVRCSYDNPHDTEITFGESTLNEMCFFVGFAAGFEGLSACTVGSGDDADEVPVDPEAGECGEHEPTDTGVGTPCTADGGECADGLSCTAEFSGSDSGVCIQLGCGSDADCGEGGYATCCTPQQGGGAISICIPEACRTPSCIPVEG